MESVEIASPPNANHTNTPHKTKRTELPMPQILRKRKSRRKQNLRGGLGSVSLKYEFGILPLSPSGPGTICRSRSNEQRGARASHTHTKIQAFGHF
jgi:hypothetical protein